MTLDQPNVGDNLRLVQLDRVHVALAALRLMKSIENGTGIVPCEPTEPQAMFNRIYSSRLEKPRKERRLTDGPR
jgi:hypothetical protein